MYTTIRDRYCFSEEVPCMLTPFPSLVIVTDLILLRIALVGPRNWLVKVIVDLDYTDRNQSPTGHPVVPTPCCIVIHLPPVTR